MFVNTDKETYKIEYTNQKLLAAINPNEIQKIEVFKDKKALRKFGELGVNGVIVVDMKNNVEVDIPKRFLYKKK